MSSTSSVDNTRSRLLPRLERLESRHGLWPSLGSRNCAAGVGGNTVKKSALETSRALWNRSGLTLDSDEVLAQLLDRGEMPEWRALYSLAKTDARLRSRIQRLISTAPLPLPHFWLAALKSLGEEVDWDQQVLDYFESTGV